MTLRAILIAIVTLLALQGAPTAAHASCSATATIDFGSVDLSTNNAFTQAGTLNISCSGLSDATYRVCPVINGTRVMARASGGGTLTYDLYSDVNATVQWGEISSDVPEYSMVVSGGSGQLNNLDIYAKIDAGQSSAPTTKNNDQYASTLTINVDVTNASSNPSCASQFDGTGIATVTATYPPSCTITASPLDFGSILTTGQVVDADTTVEATCTVGSAYSIKLSDGLAGANPELRRMTSGVNELAYGIYHDAARTLPWGATDSYNDKTGTGTGSNETFTAYGRVHVQTTPPTGSYSDTVVVSIDF